MDKNLPLFFCSWLKTQAFALPGVTVSQRPSQVGACIQYDHVTMLNTHHTHQWLDLAQGIRMDLNKKSKPEQKTITASKGTP